MIPSERLKVDRALSIQPSSARTLRLVTTPDDRSERPTDPVSHEPPSAPGAAPLQAMPPNAKLPSLGANPSFAEDTMRDLLETAKRLEEHHKALLDPSGLLTEQTKQISTLIDANYRLIHGEVIGIRGTLDLLAPRVTATEGGLAELRAEFASMKLRMGQIETALGLKAIEGSNVSGAAEKKTE